MQRESLAASRGGPAPLPVFRQRLGPKEDQYVALRDWVASLAEPGTSLIDVGAGDGDDDYRALVRPLVGRMVGVDPDARPGAGTALDECHCETIESFSRHSTERFGLALAVYVAEHVTDPVGFLRACRACLEPGASLFVLTPNLWHYFGLAARAAGALGAEDLLLARLRARRPHHVHHTAHFPVAYRLNTVGALSSHGAAAGFSALEIRHLENPSVFETYLPTRLAFLPRAYSFTVNALGAGGVFGTLLCRLVNAPAEAGSPP